MIKGIIGADLAGSGLVHTVNGFPCPTLGKVISVERSGSELVIHHTNGPTDVKTTLRHPIDSLEIKRDEKTGEIQVASTNGTTVIRPSKR